MDSGRDREGDWIKPKFAPKNYILKSLTAFTTGQQIQSGRFASRTEMGFSLAGKMFDLVIQGS